MALDGRMLCLLAEELRGALLGGKVDKVCQPDRDELLLVFRSLKGTRRLLLSASAMSARVCLTEAAWENPAAPPMFCMLLRKHLTGGKLTEVATVGLERVLFLTFDCYNEFGDPVKRRLAVEIMGKHSNIVLIGESGVIVDAVKRVDFTASKARQILPGLRYELPPFQDKLDPLQTDADTVVRRILSQGDLPLDKAVQSAVQGFSPVVCRELAYGVLRGGSKLVSEMNEDEAVKLKVLLMRMLNEDTAPCLALDPVSGRPVEFAFVTLHQYGTAAVTKTLPSFSALVETAFSERARADTRKRKQEDLLRILTAASDRITRKTAAQKNDLAACADKETYRKFGDLISSNIWKLQKGMKSCMLDDFYDGGTAEIPLDDCLTPAQNAQRYYKKYRKAATAETVLAEQIAAGERELLYLDSVFDELTRAETVSEIAEVRAELAAAGYVRVERGVKQKVSSSEPRKFLTDAGLPVFVGRNNVQNDKLTLKTAENGYLWFHTKNIPGSHTVLAANAADCDDTSILQAATLAATFSKAAEAGKVPVDYTQVRYVKKPSGAKPGMVIYTDQKTLFVTPDKELAERLERK